MGYSKSATKGVVWMGFLRGSIRAISYVKIAIVARILGPEEFGIFGIASILLALVEVFSETGIHAFLIQEENSIKKYLNTAWIISIVRGVLVSAVILVISHPVSLFFGIQDSVSLLRLIALAPLIRGLVNPAVTVFHINLEFSKEFVMRFLIYIVDAVSTIFLAVFGFGVFSLVYGMILSAVSELILSFGLVKQRPRFKFNRKRMVEIINSGKWITFTGISSYLFRQFDDIVVGKLLGTYSLGIYQLSYKISILPLNEISEIFLRVSFPVFVKVRNDKKRLIRAYKALVVLIVVIVLPITLLIFSFPKQVILIVLGSKWVESYQVVRILVVFGAIRAITGSTSSLFLSVKKQRYTAIITSLAFFVLLMLICPLTKSQELEGTATAVLLSWLATVPLIGYYFWKFKNEN